MKTQSRRLLITLVGGFALVLVLIFGGFSVTANAAQTALPGDALYPVKTSLESARIRMASDSAGRAQLQIAFAEQRLEEISRLFAEGRFERVTQATASFDTHIQRALSEVELVAGSDSQTGLILTARISETLSRYGRVLGSMIASVPEPVRIEMQLAIDASNLESTPVVSGVETEFGGVVESMTAGAWVIGGQTFFIHTQTELKDIIQVGDFVKVHAALNGDGDLVAREIELSTPGEFSNENGNLNGNLNDNSNTNESLPGNFNLNANSNDDNGGAMNGNTNSNFNSNQNNNTNINDDNGGNSNTNDNSGGNSNGDDNGGNSGKGGGD